MAFKMKMKEYGKGKSPIQMKGETPTKFLKGLGGKVKGAMKKGGAGALIGGALLGPLGAAAGAAIQRRRNKKKAAAAGGDAAMDPAQAAQMAEQMGFPAAAADAGTPKVDPAAAAAAPVDPAMDPAAAAAPMAMKGRKPKGKKTVTRVNKKMTKTVKPANKPRVAKMKR